MKKYEAPMLNVSLFDAENVVTDGSQPTPPGNTAVDMALQDAAGIATSANTFSVVF